MAEDITVVKVVWNEDFGLQVYFSEPVRLRDLAASKWWWVEADAKDELAAYRWGLKIIEEHKRMEQEEKHNA